MIETSGRGWTLVYDGFDPAHEPLREALCTLGNGYFATRGAAEESSADGTHYPGTYLAGGYNRAASEIAGRTIVNEDLVNFPNWLRLRVRPEGGAWLNLRSGELYDYRQELDLYRGLLVRQFTWRDEHGHETSYMSRRFVSMHNPHEAAIQLIITPRNWEGRLDLKSELDGSVVNAGVARYRDLISRHLEIMVTGPVDANSIMLVAQTTQSQLRITQVARTLVYRDDKQLDLHPRVFNEPETVGQDFELDAHQGVPLVIEKTVSLYASRDHAISECSTAAREHSAHGGRFNEMLRAHELAWAHLWERCDVTFDDHGRQQLVVRLHIFHLLQTVSPHSIDLDVGVPARGLHGEAYRGHIFWDELFIFPFYTFRIPDITRSLLLYRFRRLGAARRLASESGYRGAMYPWQSASDGSEQTPNMHLNPRSGTWGIDLSHRQRHVNVAIAYNIWHYYTVTDDYQFVAMYGAEMILEIARFCASLTSFDEATDRYCIIGVMGPDEYHERYPGSTEPGLRNNAYTNVMVVWVLERALVVLERLEPRRRRALCQRLELTDEEVGVWQDIGRRMTVPFHGDGIISQFEGYEDLEEFDWAGYRRRYGNIERLDRILKSEGDTPDRYKVSKQADVLMLFYLLSPGELKGIFHQLGYPYDDGMTERNVHYYLARTSHGSTLSKLVHTSVLDRIDRLAAWELFCDLLESDISDAQQGTTPEGIHVGAMAGALDIVLRHYAGISLNDRLGFSPHLPESLARLHLRLRYRRQWYDIEVTADRLRVAADADGVGRLPVQVGGVDCGIRPGEVLEFSLPLPGAVAAEERPHQSRPRRGGQ